MKLLIYGAGEFAEVITELAQQCGYQVAGYVSDMEQDDKRLGSFEDVVQTHPPKEYFMAIAIGYNNLDVRWDIWKKVKKAGYKLPPLIHPKSYVADSASIGEGAMIMAGVIVDIKTKVGDVSVLWPGVCLNHNSEIGKNIFISPNATICGACTVGKNSFIGAGAVIVDHCNVPDRSFIKANSTFTRKT